MRKANLLLSLLIFFLVLSYLVASVSAEEQPGTAPPLDEDPCMNIPPGDEQNLCYLNLIEKLGPEDQHCEDLHTGAPAVELNQEDIARYEAQYRANGALSPGSYQELEGKGFTRTEIDCHVAEMAEAVEHDKEADEPIPPEVLAEMGEPPGQPDMQGDPCMAVPAGPDRDNCYATMPPPGQPGTPPGQPGAPAGAETP